MDAPVVLNVEDGIATLKLNKPKHRNALSRPVTDGIRSHLADLRKRSDVRVLVVEGAGEAFSAGGDIEWMENAIEANTPLSDRVSELQATTHRAIADLFSIEIPTIAAIDGPAVGAGATLAIACDMQVISTESVMGFVFRNVGLAVDSGTSFLLPRVVGTNTAKELVVSGRILDAREASEIGLVNEVVDAEFFEEELEEFVEPIATGPTVALSTSTRLIDEAFGKSLEKALQDEATSQGVVFDSKDHVEGIEAFQENREPNFEGR